MSVLAVFIVVGDGFGARGIEIEIEIGFSC